MTSLEAYQNLLNDLSRVAGNLDRLHGPQLSCQAGCSGCCQQHLSVFEIEALHLKQALQTLAPSDKAQVQAQAAEVRAQQREACPLLIEERCSIYQARPVICRTHGYPIHFEGEEEGEIILDVCPLNFTEKGSLEALELNQTLPLDRLNLRLAAINYVYCRDQLQDLERAHQRQPLAEIIDLA